MQLKSRLLSDVKKVYHMADIHIRLNSDRYTEYKEVFEKVYQEIKKDSKDSIIVLCGDILHSKNELTPECVDLTIDFLKNLANITDLIIIMGNHDGNLSNKTKLDSLSPLIKEIKAKNNIHYLLNSGIYIYNNLVFGNSSLMDDKFVYAKDIKVPNKIKIALYHGAVNNSVTSVGFRLNSELTIDEFDGYNYVLLGDIHKFQYMNEGKTICYPSSLIQQNYGESLNNHGLVKWDLENKTSTFIEIQNNYGYCYLNIKKGKLEKSNLAVPKNPRIKLLIEETDSVTLLEISKSLRKQYNVQELTYSFAKTDKPDKKDKKSDSPKELCQNLQDINYQNKLIRDYTSKYMKLDKEEVDGLLKINNELNKEIELKKIITNKWKILSLDFSNMFCYGANNEINFKNSEGIIGLFAPNHSGKSSIVDIILFTLFDKCSRGLRTDILNQKKTNFHCRITLEIDGNEYVIMRIGKLPKKNAKGIKIDVHFWKKDNQDSNSDPEYILLNGIDRNDTNRIITDLIGTYEDYIMTSFCLQKEVNFIDYPQSKKKEFLMKILKLNIYDELLELSKITHKAKTIKLKDLTDKTKNIDIYEIRNLLADYETKKLEIQNTSEEAVLSIEKYHEKIELCNKKLINIKNIPDIDLDEINYKIAEIDDEINKLEKQVGIIQNNFNKYDKELKKYQNEYNKFDSQEIEDKYQEFKEGKILKEKELNTKLKELYESKKAVRVFDMPYEKYVDLQKKQQIKINNMIKKISVLEESIKDTAELDSINELFMSYQKIKDQVSKHNLEMKGINKEIDQMNNKLDKLKEHKYDPNCKYCINNIFVKDAIETKELLEIKLKEQISIKEKIDKLTKSLSLKKYLNIELTHENLNNDFESNIEVTSQIKDLKLNLKLLEKEMDLLNKTIKEYESESVNSDHNNKVSEEITFLEEEIEINKNSVSDEYNNYKVLKNKVNELTNLTKEKEDKIKKYNNKITELKNTSNSYKDTIDNLKEYIETKKNNDDLNSSINDLKVKIIKLQKDLKKNTETKDSFLEKIFLLKKEIEIYDLYSKDIKELEKEVSLYKNYTKLVNKDGLPYILLNNLIPELQKGTNNILMPLTNFSISIEQEKDSINIYKINEDNKLNIELCSGFEKFTVNLAIRITLSGLSKLSSCNFMLIDEGFSCMDNSNINNLNSLFNTLKDMFDFVIVISHLDSVKSQCDNYMTIDRNKDGSSKIEYA